MKDEFYTFPVPGGPGLLRWLPCEYGPTGHCSAGRHQQCAHNFGGAQYGGKAGPAGYLMRRDGTVIPDNQAHPIVLLPEHVWNCTCSCHSPEAATDLLAFIPKEIAR